MMIKAIHPKRYPTCKALKLFNQDRFLFCLFCMHFFKSGSKVTCTAHRKTRVHYIPLDLMHHDGVFDAKIVLKKQLEREDRADENGKKPKE
jgi:hypothetical protein